MRSRNFYLIKFLLILYKVSFRVPDMNFDSPKIKMEGSPSPFSYHGNHNIFSNFSDLNLSVICLTIYPLVAYIFNAEHFSCIILAGAICQPILEI